jgi:hypothetical protein
MRLQDQQGFMHAWLSRVIREVGPRESCGDAEKQAGREIARIFSDAGADSVQTESFRCHPRAFLGFFPMLPLCYLLGVVAWWWAPSLALIPVWVGASITLAEVVYYRRVIDRFFPEAEGENVLGFFRPTGEVQRRVVVCAHLDSAYEFNWFLFLRQLAIPSGIFAVLFIFFFMLATLGRTVGSAMGAGSPALWSTLGWIAMAGFPLISLFFFFHTQNAVPGAMDDLAGVAVLGGLARSLGALRSSGENPLAHTEVLLLASSGEEAGLRGAMAFVKQHTEQLHRVPTSAVILDGIYDERLFTVVDLELFTGARADPRLAEYAREAAAKRRLPVHKLVMIMGATDATAFARGGIPAISLVLAEMSILPMAYHTRWDTPDRVRPESLQAALEVTADIIERVDRA